MMTEERGVDYKDKIAADTIRGCILTDRMVTMMNCNFAFDEIMDKFKQDGYDELKIIRTYNLIIEAGSSREKIIL